MQLCDTGMDLDGIARLGVELTTPAPLNQRSPKRATGYSASDGRGRLVNGQVEEPPRTHPQRQRLGEAEEPHNTDVGYSFVVLAHAEHPCDLDRGPAASSYWCLGKETPLWI